MDWAKPLTRVLLHRVIAWPSFRELAGNLERATIPVLGQLIDHRNRATGQCNPSRDVLGGETAYSPRTVSAATAQLMAKGLIGKEQARSRGWASTNDYWLTPKFFELVSRAYSVGPGCNFRRPPAAIFAARGLQFSQTNGDPPDPATWNAKGEGEPSAPPQRSPPRPSHRRPFFHAPPGFPPPHFSRGQKGGGGGDRASADPEFQALATWFAEERAQKYEDGDPAAVQLRPDNQARLLAFVVDLTGEAGAWAEQHGITVDRAQIREDLVRRLVRAWLELPGTNGALTDRRHPIGLLVGDLGRVGAPALAEWKRAQRPPKAAPEERPTGGPERAELRPPPDEPPRGTFVIAALAAGIAQVMAGLGEEPRRPSASRALPPGGNPQTEVEAPSAPPAAEASPLPAETTMQVRWVPAGATAPLPATTPPPPERTGGAIPSGADVPPSAPPGEPAAEVGSVLAGSPRGATVASLDEESMRAEGRENKGATAPLPASAARPEPRRQARACLAPRDEAPPLPRVRGTWPSACGTSVSVLRRRPIASPSVDPNRWTSNDLPEEERPAPCLARRRRGREPPN